jgi:plastocyanin
VRFLGAVLIVLAVQPRPDAGIVEGTIRLAPGIELEPTYVANTTDPEICGEGRTLDDILVSESNGLANVIVTVRNAPAVDIEPETLVLDNVECRFEPHAAAVTVGSTVEAHNSDDVLHTTHLYGPQEMNVSLPIQGMKSSRVLDRPGLYAVKCDVHGWMQAFVRVDPHPFHAVSSTEGRFRIAGLPPGSYTLELWHEKLGPLEHEVRIDGTAAVSVEVEYTP